MANLKNLKKVVLNGQEYNLGWSENDFTTALKEKLEGVAAGAQVNVIEEIQLDGQKIEAQGKVINIAGLQKKMSAGTGISLDGETINCTLDTEVFKIVPELPEKPAQGDEKKIHAVSNSSGSGKNVFTEYLFLNGAWEIIGEFKADVDLTPYLKSEDAEKTYLKQADATSTYLSKVDAGNTYLTQENAGQTYLTQSSASSTYLTQENAAGTYLSQVAAESTYLTQDAASKTYAVATDVERDYVQKDGSKVLSTNDYTTAEKEKLAGIEANANKIIFKVDEGKETLTITGGAAPLA